MARCSHCGRSISGFGFGRRLCPWCQQAEAAARGEDVDVQRVETVPWKRPTSDGRLVTQVILGLNVAVFVGMLLAGAGLMGADSLMAIHWGANFAPMTLSGQWWRLVTSCFVHFGLLHIGFNMWCLWSLGDLAERLYGRATFAVLYLLCGIGGSLGSLAWHSAPVVSAGASGAIFGIAGAIIASLKLGNTTNRWMASSIMRSLLVFVGFNVVIGAASGITDNACHIGGLLTGLIVGALIAKFAPANDFGPRLAVLGAVVVLLLGWGFQLQRSSPHVWGYHGALSHQSVQPMASPKMETPPSGAALTVLRKS
jgi:rhomboid protease GluP